MTIALTEPLSAPCRAVRLDVTDARERRGFARRDRGAAEALAAVHERRRRPARPSKRSSASLAYAAHELRGELALQRALAEVALADPNADAAALREMGERVVAACERQERLLEALLTLARSECRAAAARARRPRRDCRRSPASPRSSRTQEHRRRSSPPGRPATRSWSSASSRTWSRTPSATTFRGGRLDVATYTAAGRAIFTIANTGPLIPAGELTRLFQPFQRLALTQAPLPTGSGSASRSCRRSPTRTTPPSPHKPEPAAASESTWPSPLSTERNRTSCVAAVHSSRHQSSRSPPFVARCSAARGCGGGGGSPAVASVASSTPAATTTTTQSGLVAFSQLHALQRRAELPRPAALRRREREADHPSTRVQQSALAGRP